MPRPTNKKQVIELSDKNYNLILEKVRELGEEEVVKLRYNGRAIKDDIAHLAEWSFMVVEWYKIGLKGKKPDFNFKDCPKINKEIDKKHKKDSLKKVLADFKKSHKGVMEIVEKHNNKELFTKRLYPWTGSTSMACYFISATSSHYDWALKLMKKYLK